MSIPYFVTPVQTVNGKEYIVQDNDTPQPTQHSKASENIRVVVRVRPFNDTEHSRAKEQRSVDCFDDNQSIQLTDSEGKATPMRFNEVFSEDASQEQIFEQCGVTGLVLKALEGYSTTVFAFGQTGSGKTFTITGPSTESKCTNYIRNFPQTAGIIPRALRFLFDTVSQRPGKYSIKAAYLEIYNESVKDLLNPQSSIPLAVRWNSKRGFFVENSFVIDCLVLEDCLAVLEEGLRNRSTGSHQLNQHSSRSHSLMTLYIESYDSESGALKTTGKISFVDLAGSEKVKDSQATGATLTETLSINKSLLTLGNCISCLSDKSKRNGHIPYRDSKLTKLLADSLGGRGLALMIANIGPSLTCMHETLKTLRYAQRASKIKNRPQIGTPDTKEALIARLRRDLKEARMEGDRLRSYIGGSGPSPNVFEGNSAQRVPHIQQVYAPPPEATAYNQGIQYVAPSAESMTFHGIQYGQPIPPIYNQYPQTYPQDPNHYTQQYDVQVQPRGYSATPTGNQRSDSTPVWNTPVKPKLRTGRSSAGGQYQHQIPTKKTNKVQGHKVNSIKNGAVYQQHLPPVPQPSQRTRIEIDSIEEQTAFSFQARFPTLKEIGEYNGNLNRDLSYLDAEIERFQ